MTTRIERPEGDEALTELITFQDRVYEGRRARWPALVGMQLPVLTGEAPSTAGRTYHPLVARNDSGSIVARAVALVDQRYIDHWDDPLGHVLMFEALPETHEAVRALMDEACGWLRQQGMTAARAGFGGGSEFPFVLDDYESLPPFVVRHNPAHYHSLLKEARFESEKGWVDYKIEVRPELVQRWEGALDSARRAGFDIVPLADLPEADRTRLLTEVWNAAFAEHWGAAPISEAEFTEIVELLGPMGMLDCSVLAFRGDSPVGVVWASPETTMLAVVEPGQELRDDERLNFLGIGVLEEARGRGVNLAMAAYAYLELARRGQTWMSYTLVLDDNWPSRRTGEKLGGTVCANYMVYRRELGRRR